MSMQDLSPVFPLPRATLLHVLSNEVILMAVLPSEVRTPPCSRLLPPPSQCSPGVVLEALHDLARVFEAYFRPFSLSPARPAPSQTGLTTAMIKDNFSTVYLLLEEVVDSGCITVGGTSPPPPSRPAHSHAVLPSSQLARPGQAAHAGGETTACRGGGPRLPRPHTHRRTTTQGVSAVSEEPPRTAPPVPPAQAKASDCTLAVDVVDTLRCVMDASGAPRVHRVQGELWATAAPPPARDVELTTSPTGAHLALGPAASLRRYHDEGKVVFAPVPTPQCILRYALPASSPTLPVHCSPALRYHDTGGCITLTAGRRESAIAQSVVIERLVVSVSLPPRITRCELKCSTGSALCDERSRRATWTLGRGAGTVARLSVDFECKEAPRQEVGAHGRMRAWAWN